MKKTIAILLVLVIGMVGVFADITVVAEADAAFKVTTSVTPVNRMAVTSAEAKLASSATSLTAWDNYVTTNALTTIPAPASEDLIGYLNIATNNVAGVAVKVSATPMTSTDAATDGYEIGYYITVNGSDKIVSGYSNSGLTPVSATPKTTVVETTETAANGSLSLTTYAINAELDNLSFENAPTAINYEGTVTFEFVVE